MRSKKIAVLFHERTHRYSARGYAVHALAQYWRADGHRPLTPQLQEMRRHRAAGLYSYFPD